VIPKLTWQELQVGTLGEDQVQTVQGHRVEDDEETHVAPHNLHFVGLVLRCLRLRLLGYLLGGRGRSHGGGRGGGRGSPLVVIAIGNGRLGQYKGTAYYVGRHLQTQPEKKKKVN